MKDTEKPKQQLINELAELRQRITELEKSEKGRKRAEDEMKRLNRDLSTLYTIDFAAAQSLDMEIMLNKVLETVLKALEIEAGSIYLREPNGDMTLYVYHGFSGEFVNNMQRINGEGVFGAAYTEKKPVVLDASEYPANRFASFIIQEEFHTLVIVPLISGGELIGILCMASHKAHAFPLGETEQLSAIGQQMGTTMRNVWLYERVQRELDERKRAEDELRKNEERFRQIAESAGEWIWDVDRTGLYTYSNPVIEKILGFKPHEIVGKKHFYDLFAPYVREELKKAALEAFDRKEPLKSFVNLNVHKNLKHHVILETTGLPVLDEEGNLSGYRGVNTDITERMRSLEVLEESEKRFRSVVQSTPDAVIISDGEGNIITWNKGAKKIFLYDEDEVLGKPLTILMPERYRDAHLTGLKRVTSTGEYKFIGKRIEMYGLRKDGTEIPLELSISTWKAEKGTFYSAIINDITERKKAEETRLENERLAAADKAKSEFLANMSHELRTPLNSILGFSEFLKRGLAGKLDEKQEHFIDNIFTSGTFLLSLIDDILDLSKIEAGKIELVPEKMSVPVTIKETLSLIKEKAMKRNVLMKTEFVPELEFIEADKQRFKQILFNLLSNAVKFSKEEGGAVTIRAKKEGGMAQISVSDTGIGIREENLSKLFHKFEQLESGISQKYGGTGLGLAITKHLVELHGGKIRAQSRYGEGSTFTFLIPLIAKKGGENK